MGRAYNTPGMDCVARKGRPISSEKGKFLPSGKYEGCAGRGLEFRLGRRVAITMCGGDQDDYSRWKGTARDEAFSNMILRKDNSSDVLSQST